MLGRGVPVLNFTGSGPNFMDGNTDHGSPNNATRQAQHYIFRWKSDGTYVTSSRRRTPDEVWAFALEWLRPAHEPRAVGRAFVRRNGEVIPDGE